VDDRAISISAKLSERKCARLASNSAAEMSRPKPRSVRYVPSRSAISNPFGGHAEWHESAKSADHHSEIGTARCPRDLSFQPPLAELRLKQAENGDEEKEHGSERDAEPPKKLSRMLHQKACPRLM
jgi:hypothetical protein